MFTDNSFASRHAVYLFFGDGCHVRLVLVGHFSHQMTKEWVLHLPNDMIGCLDEDLTRLQSTIGTQNHFIAAEKLFVLLRGKDPQGSHDAESANVLGQILVLEMELSKRKYRGNDYTS